MKSGGTTGPPTSRTGCARTSDRSRSPGRRDRDGTWEATAYLQGQDSSQSFSSVNTARTAETPASHQFDVPATAVGFAASSTLKDSQGGIDNRRRRLPGRGRGDARGFPLFRGHLHRAAFRRAGARLRRPLRRAQPALAPGSTPRRASASTAGRTATATQEHPNRERSAPPADTATPRGRAPSLARAPGSPGRRRATAWDPRRGPARLQAADAERALPALPAGNTTTLANPALSTEHADTGEVGATWKRRQAWSPLTGFAARLDNPVANVTLAQGPGNFPLFGTPAGGCRRTGAAEPRAASSTRGAQLGADVGAAPNALSSSSLPSRGSATVGIGAGGPALVGKTLPEVPRWNASLGVPGTRCRRFFLSVRVRGPGSQFDDDQNLLPLSPAAVADASLRLSLSARAEISPVSRTSGTRGSRRPTARSASLTSPQRDGSRARRPAQLVAKLVGAGMSVAVRHAGSLIHS